MSRYTAGIFDDPAQRQQLRQRLESERTQEDRIIEINQDALAGDGRIGEQAMRSPGDVESWLEGRGFSDDVAEFYAEAVRTGHCLLIFEAQQDDEHYARATDEMRKMEPAELQRALERWRNGDRSVWQRTEPQEAGEAPMATGAATTGEAAAPPATETRQEERIPVVEEEMRVGKREAEGGGVQVRSHVEQEPVQEQVQLREERATVDRTPVDREASPGEQPFEEREVSVGEHREEPVVSKEARVVEEVSVGKAVSERTETIEDRLRKTVVDVDRLGDVDESQFRPHFEQAYGGEPYEAYGPAYKLGYGYGREPELQDVEYERAEPALQERYEAEHGRGTFARVRDAFRHGWQRARGQS